MSEEIKKLKKQIETLEDENEELKCDLAGMTADRDEKEEIIDKIYEFIGTEECPMKTFRIIKKLINS